VLTDDTPFLAEGMAQWVTFGEAKAMLTIDLGEAEPGAPRAGDTPLSSDAGACVNDDSTTSRDGSSTCSSWYDDHPDDCGRYDDGDFDAAAQCCMCRQADEAAGSGSWAESDGGIAGWALSPEEAAAGSPGRHSHSTLSLPVID
jgi:hypothetical protein